MTRRSIGRATASVLVLTLALTGCASGGTDGERGAAAAEEVELGPLDEYFQRAYGEFDEDRANREMRRAEELVADCMSEQGFDYIPMDPAAQGGMSMSSDDLDVEWGTREFAEQYGYGMTTNPFGEIEESMPEEEFVDPNADYVGAMSETEREAFYVALHGDQVFPDDPEAEFEYDWEQSGCQGRAQHEVYEGGQSDPSTASLEEEINALWEQTQQDPRVTEVTAAWITCMGDAGLTGLATVDDAQMQFSEKLNAVYEDAYSQDPEQMPTEEELAEMEAKVQARIGELTEDEIATAVADFDCREEVGYDDTLQEVTFDLQEQFVETHRDELEAWVEATTAERS